MLMSLIVVFFFNLSVSFNYISFLETFIFEENELSGDIDYSLITMYEREIDIDELFDNDNIDQEFYTASTEQSIKQEMFLFL
jgi:hypothetical protein